MCTAGRNTGNRDFECDAMIDQIGVYLQTLEELDHMGYSHGPAKVGLTDFSEQNSEILLAVRSKLLERFPSVTIEVAPDRIQAKGYYYPFCFWIFVTGVDGAEQNICDGGFTDWTQQFLGNKKERLLISGMGTERLCFLFSPKRD